jgi:hypothetical protein
MDREISSVKKGSETVPAAPSDTGSANNFISLLGILSPAAIPVVMLFLGGDWVTRQSAMSAYIWTIVVLFAGFLLLIYAEGRLQNRPRLPIDGMAQAYVTLAIPFICLLIILTTILRLPTVVYISLALLIHLIFLLIWIPGRRRLSTSAVFASINRWVVRALPLLAGGIFWAWAYFGISIPLPGKRAILLLAIGAAGLAVYLRFELLRKFLPAMRKYWWVYLCLLLVLVGLVYQPELPFDRHHLGLFLAPVNDVLHGKWLLVDSATQYGIGAIYALAAGFRTLGLPVYYSGMSLIVDLLFLLQYAVLFLILRRATKSLLLSLAGIGAILYFNFLATAWPSMLSIPAQSPLRYGMIYLLLWIALCVPIMNSKLLRYLEPVLLGLASFWSLETFLYVFVSVDAFHFVSDVLYADRNRDGLIRFGKRLAGQAAVVLAVWGIWLIATFAGTGSFPRIQYYLEIFTFCIRTGDIRLFIDYRHIVDYRSLGIGLFAAAYLVSIMAVLYFRIHRRKTLPWETASLLTGFSAAGLMQNLYYFVYEIDFHMALICVPLIVVIALWLGVILHDPAGEKRPVGAKAGFGLAVLVSAWICVVHSSPNFASHIRSSLIFQLTDAALHDEKIAVTDPYQAGPSNESVDALVTLIGRYAPDDPQIAVFARNEDQIESLLLTGKTSLLDFSDPLMCSVSRSYSEHVLALARESAGGPEYIFYDAGEGSLIPLQEEVFRLLTSGATYRVIDRMEDMVVYRKDVR